MDCLGLPVTYSDAQQLSVINDFIVADVTYAGVDYKRLRRTIKKVPDAPMLHVYNAICTLYMDSHSAGEYAKPQIAPLQHLSLNPREAHWFSVLQSWVAGDLRQSVKKLQSLLSQYPQDLVAARLGIVHCLMQGDQPSMLDIARVIMTVPRHQTDPPALSFVSFVYLENDDLEEAERYARRALDIDPHLAWAQHNLAHVHATRDQFHLGIEVLEGRESDWKGSFIRAHCYWHLAIFYILTGCYQDAIRIYWEVLIAMDWWHVVNLINVLSLLLYLDLFGQDVVPLISSRLLQRLRERERWNIDSLVDLLTVWALARSGDTCTAQSLACLDRAEHQDVWHASCSAMLLLTTGGRQDAAALLRPLADDLKVFGGSNEQRKAITDACLLTRAVAIGDR